MTVTTDKISGWPSNQPAKDPAPTPQEVALERMATLLSSVTTSTLDQLRDLRNEIDTLMRIIQERNGHISEAFIQHVQLAANAIQCKNIIKENLTKISETFKNGIEIPKNVT